MSEVQSFVPAWRGTSAYTDEKVGIEPISEDIFLIQAQSQNLAEGSVNSLGCQPSEITSRLDSNLSPSSIFPVQLQKNLSFRNSTCSTVSALTLPHVAIVVQHACRSPASLGFSAKRRPDDTRQRGFAGYLWQLGLQPVLQIIEDVLGVFLARGDAFLRAPSSSAQNREPALDFLGSSMKHAGRRARRTNAYR